MDNKVGLLKEELCWFCNKSNEVISTKMKTSWNCIYCHQYNGFSQNSGNNSRAKEMAFKLNTEFDITKIEMKKLNPPNNNSKLLAFTLENVLTPKECKSLIEDSEQCGYSEAMINAYGNVEVLDTQYRKSSRFIIDDKEFVTNLWSRISPFIPQTYKAHKVIGLNERLRFLRYDSGDFFAPHSDACYVRPDGSELSLITIQIYLNDGFSGGETSFLSRKSGERLAVVPKTGMILVFDQRLYHEGSKLINGRKYTIRTDIMFKK